MDGKIFFDVTIGIWLGCIGTGMYIAIRTGIKLLKSIGDDPSSQGIGIVDTPPGNTELTSRFITMLVSFLDASMATLLGAIGLYSSMNDNGHKCPEATCVSLNLASFAYILLTVAGSALMVFQRGNHVHEDWKAAAPADLLETKDKRNNCQRYLGIDNSGSIPGRVSISIVTLSGFVCIVLLTLYLLLSPFVTKETTASWTVCFEGRDIPFFTTWIVLFANVTVGVIIEYM